MKVNLKSVGDRIVVYPRRKTAGADQVLAIEAATLCDHSQLLRCISREPPAAAADVDAQLVGSRCKAALQSAHHGRCDTRGVPVHSHYRAERLKPERIAKS